jgi:hypothetical protein
MVRSTEGDGAIALAAAVTIAAVDAQVRRRTTGGSPRARMRSGRSGSDGPKISVASMSQPSSICSGRKLGAGALAPASRQRRHALHPDVGRRRREQHYALDNDTGSILARSLSAASTPCGIVGDADHAAGAGSDRCRAVAVDARLGVPRA